MRIQIIENSQVANVIEAQSLVAAQALLPEATLAADEYAGVGWSYDGQTFSPPPAPSPTSADVDAERDRRLQLNFTFNGVVYQRDEKAIRRINGAGTLALGAIIGGAQPGDYRWHGESTDFEWIAFDNSTVKMDAQTVMAFGAAAATVETQLVFAAKVIKAMDPIPADYATNETYWL
jgi:hypothetical protein